MCQTKEHSEFDSQYITIYFKKWVFVKVNHIIDTIFKTQVYLTCACQESEPASYLSGQN